MLQVDDSLSLNISCKMEHVRAIHPDLNRPRSQTDFVAKFTVIRVHYMTSTHRVMYINSRHVIKADYINS